MMFRSYQTINKFVVVLLRNLVGEKKARIIIYRNGYSKEPAEVVADLSKVEEVHLKHLDC